MLFDALFDRLVGRLRRPKRQRHDESPLILNQGEIEQQKRSLFNGANNFVVKDSIFTAENRVHNIQNFIAGNPEVDPALKQIAKYANLDATMDSRARYPPPSCHPGTRLKVGDRLFDWLINPGREWNIIWLHGPAGTGKSAVAQTLAERCDKHRRLGASFFFSCLYSRSDPDTVIPSLVYQLAVGNQEYKSLVAAQLANDPELLRRKTRRTQFTKLVVGPFSLLQARDHHSVREPLLVVLDGLDECQGEGAQRELIEMISEVIRLKRNFPLLWLICSRPEAHLKYIFSRPDFTINCGREQLAIGAESIADVNFYLRDGLAGIKAEYQDVTTPMWPPEKQIMALSAKASGHFGFASISLRYIGDPAFAAPMARLDSLLSFLSGAKASADNPLGALDALYTGILCDVPDELLPTVKLMLGFKLYGSNYHIDSAQKVCNFLYIDQTTFYNAFRRLHSVVNVPPHEVALQTSLQFYHLSFEDYLRDRSRSGKFAIERERILLQWSKYYLSWYKSDLELFHTADGLTFNDSHDHGALPGLNWISDDNKGEISHSIAKHVTDLCWGTCRRVVEWDDDLLSQIRNFNFRYMRANKVGVIWRDFINKLWKNSSDGFVRTEPQNEIDQRLLGYMESMINSWWTSRPATFPLERRGRGGDYFLLGHDVKAVVCWTTKFNSRNRFGMWNCDKAPSEKQISGYHAWLVENGAEREGGVWTDRTELLGSTE